MNALVISNTVSIPENEIAIHAIRSQGAGGQNVNKVATAIHLQFDIRRSSLPDFYKQRLLALHDSRISKEGIITIKAQRHRSQEKNREDALARLTELIRGVSHTQKRRLSTKPTQSSKEKRLAEKSKRSQRKQLRGRVNNHE